jgi:hypothetical protein
MSRRNQDKGRLAPFVPLLKETLATPAWRATSHGARSLYIVLKQRYSTNFKNNGKIYLSTREASEELGAHSCRNNVGRWFRELQYYGFIVMVTPGHLGVEGRGKAPHWRLTELGYMADPPTKDFLRWDGVPFQEQKPQSHYRRMDFVRPKKQNPGPPIQATVDHPSRPLVDHPSRPPQSQSGPPIQAIQPQQSGPPIQAITRFTISRLEKSGAEKDRLGDARCRGCRPEPIGIPRLNGDLTIPTFLQRGHADCWLISAQQRNGRGDV